MKQKEVEVATKFMIISSHKRFLFSPFFCGMCNILVLSFIHLECCCNFVIPFLYRVLLLKK